MKQAMTGKNNKFYARSTLYARFARRTYRRYRQMLRSKHWGFTGVPVLFANSFPKSGTHLLTQVLQGFSQIGPAVDSGLPAIVTFQGDSGQQRTTEEILKDLKRLLPGDIGYGHLHALPEIIDYLSRPAVSGFFILRDPRDVVVSHVHYITEIEPNHVLNTYYTQQLKSFDERLRTSILGLTEANFPFPNISIRFDPYLNWLRCTEVLTIRYEEFLLDQSSTIGKIIDHAVQRGFPLNPVFSTRKYPSARMYPSAGSDRTKAIQTVIAELNPHRSPTFRSGKAGGWRQAFSEENKRLFKEISGELLISLGYEFNLDW